MSILWYVPVLFVCVCVVVVVVVLCVCVISDWILSITRVSYDSCITSVSLSVYLLTVVPAFFRR